MFIPDLGTGNLDGPLTPAREKALLDVLDGALKLGLVGPAYLIRKQLAREQNARQAALEAEWRKAGMLFPPHDPALAETLHGELAVEFTRTARAGFPGREVRAEVVSWQEPQYPVWAVRIYDPEFNEPAVGMRGIAQGALEDAMDNHLVRTNPAMAAIRFPGRPMVPSSDEQEAEILDGITAHASDERRYAEASEQTRKVFDTFIEAARDVIDKHCKQWPISGGPDPLMTDTRKYLSILLPEVIAMAQSERALYSWGSYVDTGKKRRGPPKLPRDEMTIQQIRALRRSPRDLAEEKVLGKVTGGKSARSTRKKVETAKETITKRLYRERKRSERQKKGGH